MILSNQSVAVLSKFALEARKVIGVIKATDVINDHQYACKLFIQATFSRNTKLISLTNQINSELNIEIALISALESYIARLELQNKSEAFIRDSKYFLIKLSAHLYGVQINGVSYRKAVDLLLKSISKNERTFCIELAREFYGYLKHANSVIKQPDDHQNLYADSQKECFNRLWNHIDDEFLSSLEESQLDLYINAMRKIAVANDEIVLRHKIAKIFLIKLRAFSHIDDSYRLATNHVSAFYTKPEMEDFFLVVSREFYSFWYEAQI